MPKSGIGFFATVYAVVLGMVTVTLINEGHNFDQSVTIAIRGILSGDPVAMNVFWFALGGFCLYEVADWIKWERSKSAPAKTEKK